MNLEGSILNPICIRIGDIENVVFCDDNGKKYPLEPGLVLGGPHYGFVLIVDAKGNQKEYVYPTQCRIDAVGFEGGVLKIFEEGKRNSWVFTKSGILEKSIFGDFIDSSRTQVDTLIDNADILTEEPKLINPISIKISRNPEESMILKDDVITANYPLHPGAILGSEHYGFILIIDTNKGQKEIHYPTQNKVEAVGCEAGYYDDLKVYENGKYHPWVFNHKGQLKSKASYNPYSKKDKEYVEDNYSLNSNSEDIMILKSR